MTDNLRATAAAEEVNESLNVTVQGESPEVNVTVRDESPEAVVKLELSGQGAPGEPGVGIASVEYDPVLKPGRVGRDITFVLTDGRRYVAQVFDGLNGERGPQGVPGISIGIKGLSAEFDEDFRQKTTIEFTDGTRVTVQDGKNGADGKDGEDGYTPVKGVDYWTEEDQQQIIDQVSAVSVAGIENTASGDMIVVNDSLDAPLRGLTLFGKTMQNGTPAPDAPVALESAGGDGSVDVTVEGGESITISTPNGLPGIPVSKGGNYTDESGRQWVCDEINLERRVYVQHVGRLELNGTEIDGKNMGWHSSSMNAGAPSNIKRYVLEQFLPENIVSGSAIVFPGFCSHFVPTSANSGSSGAGVSVAITKSGMLSFYTEYATLAEFTNFLKAQHAAGTPVTLYYILPEPVEAELPDGYGGDYSALNTIKPTTTVINDSGAGMQISYAADVKAYIDNLGVGIESVEDDANILPNREFREITFVLTNGIRHTVKVYNGADGYTPVRGRDYWTEEDKREIRDYVDEFKWIVTAEVDTFETVAFDKTASGAYVSPADGAEVAYNKSAYGLVYSVKAGEVYRVRAKCGSDVRWFLLLDGTGAMVRKAAKDKTFGTEHDYDVELTIEEEEDGYTLCVNTLDSNWFGLKKLVSHIVPRGVTNRLQGKIAAFDGDSICKGVMDEEKLGWAGRIAQSSNMTCLNYAKSGGTVCTDTYSWNEANVSGLDWSSNTYYVYNPDATATTDMYKVVSESEWNGSDKLYTKGSAKHWESASIENIYAAIPDADYVVLEACLNDCFNSVPLGSVPDSYYASVVTTNYAGAFEHMIRRAMTLFPTARIGVIIPPPPRSGQKHDAYHEIAREVCKKYSIPVLDLHRESGLCPWIEAQSAVTYGDATHPNAAGYEIITPKIEAWMRSL